MSYYGTAEDLLDVPEVRCLLPKRSQDTEENELLNGSNRAAFKMQEAPFEGSRSGSEEDILEYDEPVISCDICKRKRKCTLGEKILLGVAVVSVIIIIALSVAVSNSKKEKNPSIQCESSECLQAASSLLRAMDQTADPCEDFHQYACGGWLKETPIPPGYPVWDRFQEMSYKNMYMLKNLIETHELHGAAQFSAKTFYQSCMDESRVTRTDTLNDFKVLVDNMTSPSSAFNILPLLTGVHKLSTWPLFRLIVGPDERNNDRNIIKIEAADSPFPYNIFRKPDKTSVHTRSTVTDSPTTTVATQDVHTSKNINDSSNNVSVSVNGSNHDVEYTISDDKQANNFTEFPKENITELINKYLTETANLIVALGWKKSRPEAETEARKILELERRISLAHNIGVHIHNRLQAYRSAKIRDLQTKCNVIDWIAYFKDMFPNSQPFSADYSELIVLHEEALFNTCGIIIEYSKNETVQSILKMYLKLSVVRSLKPYFDLSTFQEDLRPDQEFEIGGEHWKRCTFYTNKAFGFATGAIYVNGTATHTSFKKVKNLVEYVKKAFKDYLLHKIWIDDKTKHKAEEKIDEMIEKVSYPTYIMDANFVDNYYKQFVVGTDWFRNLINWREFAVHKMASLLAEKYDRSKSWINPPVTVESDYSPLRNDIIFPIAMLHLPIYSPDGPSALNFGALGSLIGHEITHAFDVQGRQYDGFGRLRDWFDPVTANMFNITTQCMKDKYSQYKVGKLAVDGAKTLEENIADNGGVRAAMVAYELWLKENEGEKPIPGLHFNNRQIFYISFAQLFCSKWQEEGIKQFLLRDTHSPGPFRIQGALSNSLTFPDVFQCSRLAKYNPDTKCQVW